MKSSVSTSPSGTESPQSEFSGLSDCPLESDIGLLTAAADELHALANSLSAASCPAAALHLSFAASSLDKSLPQREGWWSSPFNGQIGRAQMFLRILDAVKPTAVLETGTFLGTTTSFIAKNFPGPVFTCELDWRWYLAAQIKLATERNIHVYRQDSRDFLHNIVGEVGEGPLLFYLDAHWKDDLPLVGELEFILSTGRVAVVIIDDFAVPHDAGYTFDDYGPGKALTIELLAQLHSEEATLFFPTLPASEETGSRRGCAVIGVGEAASLHLMSLKELRRNDWPATRRDAISIEPEASSSPNLEPIQRLVSSSAARVELQSLRQESDALNANANTLRKELELRDQELDISHDEEKRLRQELEASRADATAMRLSLSWRATAPLRAVGRFFKR